MSLSKKYRLSSKDFLQIKSKKGFWAKSDLLNVKIVKNNLTISCFGFVISSKISKKAVSRNKIKRQLKNVIFKNISAIEDGWDIVMIAQNAINGKKYKEISDDLIGLLVKLRLIIK